MAKHDDSESRDRDTMFGSGIGRKLPRPDRRAVIGSVAFHGALIVGLWATGFHFGEEPEFEIYAVKLISPPPQVQAPTQERVVAPEPAVVRPDPVVPPPVRTPARPQPKPTPIEEPKEEKPKPEPTKGPDPKPDSQGGENLNVDIQGQDFPYPEYLDHVIAEINRHFRGWEGSTKLKVQVFFYINRDGTVGGLDVLQRSGNFNFDLKAMSAVEAAGNRGAFGPLPEGWVQDRLYIRYTFLPPGG